MMLSYPVENRITAIQILAAHTFTDFGAADVEGDTALHRAATFGTAEEVKLMINLGTDIMIRNSNV